MSLPCCSLPRRLRLAPLSLSCLLLALLFLPAADAPLRSADAPKAPATLELKSGDHVSIIGNTLADRMQHDGWLEAYLQSRFPKHELVFRNLGFSGDEVGGYTSKPEASRRMRSANFGSGDNWLTFCKTDVIFAFFGYNESFAGEAGLEKFKADLADFIRHTQTKQYNGKSAPRLVLFSPVAHENLKDRNLPDGGANNKRLELYTKAMADVAKENNVVFVDLFKPTLAAYAKATKPLTINGIHLTRAGNEHLARIIDAALFAGDAKRDPKALETLRQAVADKDFYWFERYRTVDGFSIYGGRADEPKNVPPDQRNRASMEREMQILDVMTANRDKRVWAVAQGKDFKVDDSNTPPFVEIKTNKRGPEAGDSFPFLDGEEAIKKMTLAKGLKIELWASEKQFPELAKPVQMGFDTKGRLWVAVWPSYPHWRPKDEMNDKLLVFEDTKDKGKADKCTVFAGGLHCPTGFEFVNGGVLVAQQPDIMFLKDTKGTGQADYRERVIHGMDSADTHHASNSFVLDPGGAVYWQEGTFHQTQVETPYGPPVRNSNAGVFRYEPRTRKFEVYVPFGFANPHGHVFDRWGQDIVVDGTGAVPYHATLFSGHLDFPQKHAAPPHVWETKGIRPCPGLDYVYSKHFPDDWYGNLLVANVIGFQGIRRYKIEDNGASLRGVEQEPLLTSADPNFRPSDLKVGPDGAIYLLDWHNPLIGHLQHNLRDPNRDKVHGRIYRITYENRPLDRPEKIDGAPVEKLVELLKSPVERTRYRAKIELGARDTDAVIAAVKKWADGLDKKDPEYEHHLLEALWMHQYHNVVNGDLLRRMLTSPDFRARAAATRVLCYWRDRVPVALELLKKQADDPEPRVRLEAIRAASFFTTPEAIEVVLISEGHPTDPFLTYERAETHKALDPIVSKAIKEGREIKFTTTAGARFFLKNVTTDDLLKLKRTQAVYLELLFRPGVMEKYRVEALKGLAGAEKKSELRVLLDGIKTQDEQGGNKDESVAYDLVRLLTNRGPEELKGARADLEKMATGARTPLTRELGYVALIEADGSVEKAWALGMKSSSALLDLVSAMPLIRDPGLRAGLYPKVEPLLRGLPKEVPQGPTAGQTTGRYVRVELPGRNKTLTLAEVEVYSGGKNVARQGKATQSSTANGGDASKAIDGNTSGKYSDGGQTHTEEGKQNPWWEVDLGKEYPIQKVVVYNRTDDGLGKRLNNYTLKILDKDHKGVTFERKAIPATEVKEAYTVGGEAPETAVRRAAMRGLTTAQGKETDAFKALAKFVYKDDARADAVHALLGIRLTYWPKDDAKPLLDTLLAYIRKVPPKERTEPEVLEAVQLADSLTTLLPPDDAKKVRAELGELAVRVIRLASVVEQMRYDKERLVVKAGKPVEVLFDNADLMPHNFVVTRPGALEEIGELSEKTANEPGAAERNYVPKSPKILFASRLLQPRESTKLSFIAPAKPGVYPIVCTYPGHWRRMNGALYVVADLDEYLADPEAYLAKNPLPIQDEVLKFNRPRKEWKYDDLAGTVKEMKGGRSFGTGKHLFEVASCVSCHKLGGVGNEYGPDLTKLDPKQDKLEEILRDVLEPSFRINEKYRTYKFEMKSGKTVTGLILEEDKGMVKIIENPLAKTPPVVLKLSDIEERQKQDVSMMPKGLLDKLTHEEILDLIAYVKAKGDPKHPLFQGGGHDHGHESHK